MNGVEGGKSVSRCKTTHGYEMRYQNTV